MCDGMSSVRYPLRCDVARLCPGECQKTTDVNIYLQDVKYISTKRKYCDACKVHNSTTITQHSHVHTHIHGPYTYNQIHDREGAVPPSNRKTPALNTLQQHPPGVPRHLCPRRAAAHNWERPTARAPPRQLNTSATGGVNPNSALPNPKRPAHNSRPDPNGNRTTRPEHTAHIPAAPARHATPPRRAPPLPPTPAPRLYSAALAVRHRCCPITVTRTSRLSLFPARLHCPAYCVPPARHRFSRPTQQLVQQNRLRARLAPKLRNSAGRTAPLLLQGRTKGSGTTGRVEAAFPLVGEFRS